MATGQRSTKRPSRLIPSARRLQGRRLYFPIRTGRRRGVPVRGAREQLKPPLGWPGTLPEWALYQAALMLGYKPQQDFQFQYQLGPGLDARVDFLFSQRQVIEVQGLFWHYQFGGFSPQNDAIRKARLEAAGYSVVYIDEDALVGPRADPVYYLAEALAGRDHSRAALGVF